jgi:asparagine synthase (glutamine-hydrolysing)
VRENNVKVLLDGQGADEMLYGYRPTPLVARLRELFARGRFMRAFREARDYGRVNSLCGTSIFKSACASQLMSTLETSKRIFFGAKSKARQDGAWVSDTFVTSGLRSENRDTFLDVTDANWHYGNRSLHSHLTREIYEESLPDLLRYEDRNSMAFSVEARVPFLDLRLVDFVFRRAGGLRIHCGWTKWIHRKALENVLPNEIVWRKDKVGFDIPEGMWLRESQGFLSDLLAAGSPADEYLDLKRVGESLSTVASLGNGRTELSSRVWRWANLALWLNSVRNPVVC